MVPIMIAVYNLLTQTSILLVQLLQKACCERVVDRQGLNEHLFGWVGKILEHVKSSEKLLVSKTFELSRLKDSLYFHVQI